MSSETRLSLPASDGYPLEVFVWTPSTPVRGVVQIAHGMGEHAGRYRALAQAFNAVGVAVYANEHRGHGPEALRRGEKGNLGPRGFPGLVDDMLALSDLAHSHHPGASLVLLGHSMGSFATKIYLLDHAHRLRGAALSGTVALDLAEAGNNSAWKLKDTSVPVQVRRTPYDWLSRDEAQVDAYIADPLCGFRLQLQSRQSMYAAYARTTQLEALRRIPPGLPLYFFVGDADAIHRKLAYFNPLVERFQAAGLSDVTVRIYEGARHEVLNETNRAEVMAHLVAWVERILS
jgi:alpha-beta hydrolase superfamily lysophospholipase